jgi:membrane associated rhomboid family serine protease
VELTRRPGWQQAGVASLGFVAVLWVSEILDAATPLYLDDDGIRPRTGEGLLGVLFAPLLHGGWAHLAANSIPALVLGFLALATGLRRGLLATALIWVLGGLGVWLLAGTGEVHIGASGLVFGWLTYVVVRGFVNRHFGEIAIGLVVVLLYGGLIWGVLPGQPGISWQGHLFGAVAGVVAAFVVRERR